MQETMSEKRTSRVGIKRKTPKSIMLFLFVFFIQPSFGDHLQIFHDGAMVYSSILDHVESRVSNVNRDRLAFSNSASDQSGNRDFTVRYHADNINGSTISYCDTNSRVPDGDIMTECHLDNTGIVLNMVENIIQDNQSSRYINFDKRDIIYRSYPVFNATYVTIHNPPAHGNLDITGGERYVWKEKKTRSRTQFQYSVDCIKWTAETFVNIPEKQMFGKAQVAVFALIECNCENSIRVNSIEFVASNMATSSDPDEEKNESANHGKEYMNSEVFPYRFDVGHSILLKNGQLLKLPLLNDVFETRRLSICSITPGQGSFEANLATVYVIHSNVTIPVGHFTLIVGGWTAADGFNEILHENTEYEIEVWSDNDMYSLNCKVDETKLMENMIPGATSLTDYRYQIKVSNNLDRMERIEIRIVSDQRINVTDWDKHVYRSNLNEAVFYGSFGSNITSSFSMTVQTIER